jgi:hypothetical protein
MALEANSYYSEFIINHLWGGLDLEKYIASHLDSVRADTIVTLCPDRVSTGEAK